MPYMGGRRLQGLDIRKFSETAGLYFYTLMSESMIVMIAKEVKEVCHEWDP